MNNNNLFIAINTILRKKELTNCDLKISILKQKKLFGLYSLLTLYSLLFIGLKANAQIVQTGVTSECNPVSVQLCSTLTGSIYALNAFPSSATNSIAKYTTNFINHTLVKNTSYTGPSGLSVNFGIDRNPLTGQVFFISGQGVGSQRQLYTLNLATNAISNKGAVLSTGGNNQVQDFTFDNSGIMYAIFNDGTIQKINYNSTLLTPTAFVSGLPSNGGVGLTYDFDANRLLYATGTNSGKSLWQISTTGTVNFMFNLNSDIAQTTQAIEYVGNNICYASSSDSADIIFRINLNTQVVTSVLSPTGFVSEIKDLMYIRLAQQWSGPTGSIGNTTCINVSPTVNTTYTLISTNELSANTTSTFTVAIAPCGSSIVNLKLFIEGYFEGPNMRSVKNNQDGVSPLTDVENITVELRSATNPYNLVASTTAILKTNGTAVCTFPTSPSGSLYLVVKPKNAIETWSATPQLVSVVPLDFDFSNLATKAFGSNMKNLAVGVFGFYSGDMNQDDVVDGTDATFLDLDIFNSEFGEKITDLNGDGSVDGTDSVIYENNSFNSVFSIFP